MPRLPAPSRSPNDVGDAHEAVVNRNAEVVHGQAVAPQQHKVAQGVGVPRDITADGVLDRYVLVLKRAKKKKRAQRRGMRG